MVIWRCRVVSCDGGRIGKVWSEKFFFLPESADAYTKEIIELSNKKNPKYQYDKDQKEIDGIYGYCNWQFMVMVVVDSCEVRND